MYDIQIYQRNHVRGEALADVCAKRFKIQEIHINTQYHRYREWYCHFHGVTHRELWLSSSGGKCGVSSPTGRDTGVW